jgi:NADH pyrophosphatase NudC (nudix superfamily)
VRNQGYNNGTYTCPTCNFSQLTENELHSHYELYHSSEANHKNVNCPICQKLCGWPPLPVHIHNSHGPPANREPHFPAFSAFAWVIIRREEDGKFILVNEPAGLCNGSPKYWLPAGRVDEGETFVQAGQREALEEAGLEV